jgi:hypothetical protein
MQWKAVEEGRNEIGRGETAGIWWVWVWVNVARCTGKRMVDSKRERERERESESEKAY